MGRYINGEQCRTFEQEIAQLCQVKHCVAVSNGLDALRLIIRAYKELGVLHNDEKIIVPANTYVASVLAVSDNGLNATLCDIRNDTMNLDSHGIESLLSPSVKAIMPVHLYGTPCWDEPLMNMARHYNLSTLPRILEHWAMPAQCSPTTKNSPAPSGPLPTMVQTTAITTFTWG